MLYARWRIMGTGPPAFTEVDNPASFAENIFLRVSKIFFHHLSIFGFQFCDSDILIYIFF